MCLGIPGKIMEINTQDGIEMAKVEINGAMVDTCLETTPEAKIGDYVIVHAGFALTVMDEAEALETLAIFSRMEELENGD